jgi:hypothetical protein
MILVLMGGPTSAQAVDWRSIELQRAAAVVRIEVQHFRPSATTPQHEQRGTAVFISPQGYLVTALHVVKPREGLQQRIRIYPRRNESTSIEATVIESSPQLDIAVLQVGSGSNWPALGFSPSTSMNESDDILFMGFPAGEWATARGHISNTGARGAWRVEVNTGPGASGGPILNRCGRIVGLVVQGREGEAGRTEVRPEAQFNGLVQGYLSPSGRVPCNREPPPPPPTACQPDLRQLLQISELLMRSGTGNVNTVMHTVPTEYRRSGTFFDRRNPARGPSRLDLPQRAQIADEYDRIVRALARQVPTPRSPEQLRFWAEGFAGACS